MPEEPKQSKVYSVFREAVEDYQSRKSEKVSVFLLKTDTAEYYGVGTTEHQVKRALVEYLLAEQPKKLTITEMFDRMLESKDGPVIPDNPPPTRKGTS